MINLQKAFYYISIVFFAISSSSISSQTITPKKLASTGTDWVESITSDSIGNYFVMGRFSGTLTIDSAGNNKILSTSKAEATYIIKYNCNNSFLWAFVIDNTYRSYCFGSLKYNNGSLYAVTSILNSSSLKSTNGGIVNISTVGSYAGLFVKLDANGIYQYHNTTESSSGYVEFSDVAISSVGDIYITGRYSGTAVCKGQSASSKTSSSSVGSMDAIYLRYDKLGKSSWVKTGGGASDDVSNYVYLDGKDNLYISHQFSSNATFGTFGISTVSQWGVAYTKIDTSNGNIIWLIWSPGPMSTAGSMVCDLAGNLYLIGVFQGSKTLGSITSGVTKNLTSNGGYDVFLAKYTMDGNIIWVKTFGGTGDEWPWRSVVKDNQIYTHFQYATAFTYTTGANTYNFSGSNDDAIMGFDTSGIGVFKRTINGAGTERSWSIDFSNSGKILVGGVFSSTIAMGAASITSGASQDGYLFVIDTSNAVSLISNPIQSVCKGNSISLNTGLSSGTYAWSPGLGLNDSTISSPILTATQSGNYILKYTNPSGCVYYDTANITVTNCATNCLDCDTNRKSNKDLVFCLPFNGNSNDESGKGHNGTITGATLTTDRFGNANRAYSFNGTTSQISLTNNIPDMTNATMSIWIKPGTNNSAPFGGFIFFEGDNNCGLDYFMSIKDTTMYIYATKSGAQLNASAGAGMFALPGSIRNSWTHIVWVLQPTSSLVYLNGTLYLTINKTGSVVGNHYKLSIGAMNDGNGGGCGSPIQYYYKGELDDIRLYKRALSAYEIFNLYQNQSANAGKDTTLCNTGNYILTTPFSGTQWNYVVLSGDSSSFISKGVVNPIKTTTYMLIDSIASCKTYDTVVVTIPSKVYAGPDSTICMGSTIALPYKAASAWKYFVMSGDSGSISSNNLVKPNKTTLYLLRDSSMSCYSYDTVKITVNQTTTLSSGPDTSICLGSSYTLPTPAGTKWTYTVLSGDSSSISAGKIATPTKTTKYLLKDTTNTCAAYDTVIISVILKPIVNTINDTFICSGDSITLTTSASNYINLLWSPNTAISNINILSPKASPATTQKYYVEANNNICKAKDSVTITVKAVSAKALPDTAICSGDSVKLRIVANPNNFTWLTYDNIADTNNATPWVKPATSTKYILKVSNGTCVAYDTASIVVSAPVTVNAGQDKISCNGQSVMLNGSTSGNTYQWSPTIGLNNANILSPTVTPTSSQQYILTASNNGACGSTDTINVTLINVSVSAKPDTTICLGDSIQLKATANPNNFTWITYDRISDTNTISPFVKPTATKDYILRATNSLCVVYDTATIQVIQPVKVHAGVDTSLCEGTAIKLQGASTGNINIWQPTIAIDDTSILSPTVNPKTSQQYILYSSNNGYCQSSDTILISVISVSASAKPDTTICLGDSIQLTAVASGSEYRWLTYDHIEDTNNTMPYVKPTITKNYIFEAVNGWCKAYDTASIVIVSAGIPDIGPDRTICEGDTVLIKAKAQSGTYLWSPNYNISNVNILNPKLYPMVSTTYIFELSAGGNCRSYDTINITVNPKPIVDAGPDLFLCKYDSGMLIGSVQNADSYQWTPKDGLANDTALSTMVKPSAKTIYRLTARNSQGGCLSSDDVTVDVSQLKAAFVQDKTKGFVPLAVQFTFKGKRADSYDWNFGDTIGISADRDPLYTFFKSGIHTVRLVVRDKQGCLDTAISTVFPLFQNYFYIPNTFTPNKKEANEVFNMGYDPNGYKSIRGTIYDRWGEKIYTFEIPGGAWWDGTYRGVPVPDGVYLYMIETTDIDNSDMRYHGTITITR